MNFSLCIDIMMDSKNIQPNNGYKKQIQNLVNISKKKILITFFLKIISQ